MESRMKNWRSLHYYIENILYSTLYTIKLKICTQRFYYSSSKFSKFIQGKSPHLQELASVSLPKEKSKICPKLTELLLSSWNGPTVHVCCFMLARASTKTFVSRIYIRQPSPKNREKNLRQTKNSLAGSLVSRGITVLGTGHSSGPQVVWLSHNDIFSVSSNRKAPSGSQILSSRLQRISAGFTASHHKTEGISLIIRWAIFLTQQPC